MPDIIDAKIVYQRRSMSGCDAGPVAGQQAAYHVQVNSGTGPYTYQWSSTGTTIDSGNNANSSSVVVSVPPLGQQGELRVTVTDANGSHMIAKAIVSGIDFQLADRIEKLCLIAHEVIYHYISPNLPFQGDPVPFWRTQRQSFTVEDLRNLSNLLNRMQTIVKSIQDLR